MAFDGSRTFGVDGVIVVNLDRRPDRWEAFQVAWRDLLPWDQVVRLSASDGQQLTGYGRSPWFRGRKRDRTWAGRAGCALSHARALREAHERGWARVLIMEDDAIPAGDAGALLSALNSPGWDLLYLGAREPVGVQETCDGLVSVHGALDAHAYAVTETLRDWMIRRLPEEASIWPWIARERAVDRWMRREVGRNFRVKLCQPQVATQKECLSDITQRRAASYVACPDLETTPRPKPRPSEVARAGEVAADRVRAAVKRVVGF
ncbi:hypothetical protein ABE444_04440 [Brevundimonas pondensis]|uniref:hypothetical protein n=1 Tax=Brevundimonas pondensis TaxID=2774189 RepID=UPI00320AAAC6